MTADPRISFAHETQSLHLVVVTEARFLGEALAAALRRNLDPASVTCTTPSNSIALTGKADAVLVDAAHSNGIATVRLLREVAPGLPIIACAVPETEEAILSWAEAGVSGYVPNTIDLAEIGRVVTGILEGEQSCSARIAAALLRRISTTSSPISSDSAVASLTARERQVAELIALGLADKEIARRLTVSLSTTKTHVHNLLNKLQLARRRDVAHALARMYSGAPRMRHRLVLEDSFSPHMQATAFAGAN